MVAVDAGAGRHVGRGRTTDDRRSRGDAGTRARPTTHAARAVGRRVLGVPRHQRVEHRRRAACRCIRGRRRRSRRSSRSAVTSCIPTSARTPTTASRTSWCRRRSRSCRSRTRPTATRATPARSPCRSTRRSRVVPAPRATGTCSWCSRASCELFELYVARRSGAGWSADSGARWNLVTGDLRPIGWTSADAAGLPILPGLVRYDEVAAGSVRHAIRVTFAQTQRGFVLPATHFASSRTDPDLPPMGLRLRLRADYDLSAITGQARVIAEAMKTLRPDRRRQRQQLVLPGRVRSALGRRRPRPAEGHPRHRVRGGRHRSGAHLVTVAGHRGRSAHPRRFAAGCHRSATKSLRWVTA